MTYLAMDSNSTLPTTRKRGLMYVGVDGKIHIKKHGKPFACEPRSKKLKQEYSLEKIV